MNLSSGKTATEEREIKIRWQQYTEELYRIYPKIIDTFPETRYEDEPIILETEVKDSIKYILNRTSSGCDGIPIELLKAGEDASINILLIIFNNIWRNKEWPRDWKKSVYLPIYKKGDKKEYGNYRTIALISHASKIFLRIIQKKLEHFLIPELPIEQAGFRKGIGTRDHIVNLRWMMETAKEHNRNAYMCFIDYKKPFTAYIMRDYG